MTLAVTALIHLGIVIGEKPRINTEEGQLFTGQDTWQEPIAIAQKQR